MTNLAYEIKTTGDCCLDFYSFMQNVLDCPYVKLDEDAKRRLEVSLTYDQNDERVKRAIEDIYDNVRKLDIVDRVKYYMKRLKLEAYPWYLLTAESHTVDEPKKYVLIWTYDNDTERSYHEEFYGSGDSSTPEEFVEEYERLHKGCNIEVCDVSEVYTDPAYDIYESLGRIVSIRRNEDYES